MDQSQLKRKEPWDYILPIHIKNHGPDIIDPGKRAIWCQAFFYGGNTLRLWNDATELKVTFLSACALKKGQNVFLIGKYAAESGLTPALQSLLGRESRLAVEEIGSEAMAAFSRINSTPGTRLQWNFNYFDSLPDGSLDRVILFGAASHVANWKGCAEQIHRVLREGGRVIIAETPLGGKEFRTAVHMDAHCVGFITRILSGIGIKEEELPDVGTDELTALFQPFLRWSRAFAWQGLYLFYGQKGGKEESPTFEFPKSNAAVQAFLTRKPTKTPWWDFLAAPEIAALSPEVMDIGKRRNWALAFFGGGNLQWMWHHNKNITELMYCNLMAKPGDKVLVIGELLEEIGMLTDIKKRVGAAGEVVPVDMDDEARGGGQRYNYNNWQETRREMHRRGSGEEWDYDFADHYPDNYFDLIWLPQGVHHANNWPATAPRFLRALKPGRQIMMIECQIDNPNLFTALEMSAFLKIIIEKLYLGADLGIFALDKTSKLTNKVPVVGRAGRDTHDVFPAHLIQSFGDSLTDVHSLEWKGWSLFWGYKK